MKLTLPQQDIYFEQILYPNEPIYNIGAKLMIEGNIDYEILNKAYLALIDQHDVNRSILINNQNGVQIQVLSQHENSLQFVDFSKSKNAEKKSLAFMQRTFLQCFDFNSGKFLHQFILIKISDKLFYLFTKYHHILTDGWGTSLLFQRLVKNYNELCDFGEIRSQYPYSYKNFMHDDDKYQKSNDFIEDRDYWKKRFLQLPERFLEKINEKITINSSDRKILIIKRQFYNHIGVVAKECKCSTFHVILGVLYLYFGRIYQQTDFAIGLPVLNRSNASFKRTVGLFMGVSSLRVGFNFNDTFVDLVHAIRQQLRQDYRHQRFPLGKLIKELGVFQDKDKLFNITLSYEKQNYADSFKKTVTSVTPMTHKAERVALAIYIREFDTEKDVKIDFDYNINYFTRKSIKKITQHFENLLKDVCADPNRKLSNYQFLSKFEQNQLLNTFNTTSFDFGKSETVLSYFRRQVVKRPNHIAVQDSNKHFSYKELNILSDKISNYLIQNFGVVNRLPVAVLMNPSVDLVALFLGILKSGRAYIPLDPAFPKARLQFIIAHSEVKFIIGETDLQNILDSSGSFVRIESIMHSERINYLQNKIEVKPSDTAYIIYTSGSTGEPKGVEVGHHSLINFLLSIKQKPGLSRNDLLFSVTTPSFDISILEYFAPLISGSTLHISGKNTLSDPDAIVTALDKLQPSIIQATPSFYQMLFNTGWQGNKELKVLCGGDLLSESLAEKLINTSAEVWNMYGPTETTIWSSIKRIRKAKDARNIGKPIHNTAFYILDKYNQLLPIDTAGNIYIGGKGLAKSYFKNEPLTSKKFITNPFVDGMSIYNTGDIGKWNRQGEIVFLGRSDFQVKVRGYRVEFGEIESSLNQLSMIKSSVVIAKKSTNQEAHLVAYVILNQEPLDLDSIKNSLRVNLPEYMIPYTIISLANFPLTANMKVDRKLLASKEINQLAIGSNFEKPIADLEIKLCKYYKEVLELENEIGTSDNFFSLGGHSLNAVKLIAKIETDLNIQISLKTIFNHPTVKQLSLTLTREKIEKLEPISTISGESHYPITTPQYIIWLAARRKEKSISYNMFMTYDIIGELDKNAIETAIQKTLDKYEVLRSNFSEIKGLPYQRVNHVQENYFEIECFCVADSKIQEALKSYVNQQFNLEYHGLFRVGLFQKDNGDSMIVFVTHHIIMDGWSLEILIKEIIDRYRALISKAYFKEEILDYHFKDFVVWHQKIKLKTKKINIRFWKNYLKDYKWQNLISYDIENPKKKQLGAVHHFCWDKEFLKKLHRKASEQKTTLHNILIATFNVLVYKIQELDDICLGTINSGRPFSNSHNQIGMFAKTLPLRTKIKSNQSFASVLLRVQNDLLLLDKHQDIPLRILSTFRLEAILVLQNPEFDLEEIHVDDNLILKSYPVSPYFNRLPLMISFSIKEKCLQGYIHYDISKYEKGTIELLNLKYKKVIEQIVADISISIDEIDMELAFEKEKNIEIDFRF